LVSELAMTTGSRALASVAPSGVARTSTSLATFRSRLMSTRPKDAREVQDENQHDQADGDGDPKH
jgi:hypothetical protein